MDIYKFTGRNVEITEALRGHVQAKLDKLERFHSHIIGANVTLTVRDVRDADRRNRVEVQLDIPSGIIRAEETDRDMYAAVDKVVDVLERQLRKYKTALLRHRREAAPETPEMDLTEPDPLERPEIVRTKRFEMRPMMPEDAAVQMEALGHDFYVFIKMDTSSAAVVYRRKDGNYGLIEPRTA